MIYSVILLALIVLIVNYTPSSANGFFEPVIGKTVYCTAKFEVFPNAKDPAFKLCHFQNGENVAGAGIFGIYNIPVESASIWDKLAEKFANHAKHAADFDEYYSNTTMTTELRLIPRGEVARGLSTNRYENTVRVAKHIDGQVKTKTVWNSMNAHIRRFCRNSILHLAIKFHYEIISGRVLFASDEIESRDKDVSVLFKIVRGRNGDDVHFAMVVSDQNRFPEPFTSLEPLVGSCERYHYTAYERIVRCIDAETFIGLLKKVPAFNK